MDHNTSTGNTVLENGHVSRKSVIDNHRQRKIRYFQELLEQDPILCAQTFLDPLGTLSKLGMIELDDREISVEVTEGSLLDIVYLRELVTAKGFAATVEGNGKTIAKPIGPGGGAGKICGTVYIDGIPVTFCVLYSRWLD
jgi:hypothetical protein